MYKYNKRDEETLKTKAGCIACDQQKECSGEQHDSSCEASSSAYDQEFEEFAEMEAPRLN